MKLPKGITGFGSSWLQKGELELRKSKLREIVGLIKAYRYHQVLELIEFTQSSNYFRIKLRERSNDTFYDLLINPIEYFSCCVTSESTWMNLRFITFPDTLKQVLKAHIRIIELKVLNKPVDMQDLDALEKFEVKQIKGWDTQKIGEIIFNGYD